jgi:ketosteroid isomerase-like protein
MREETRRGQNQRVMEAFMAAIGRGDFAALESLCHDDFVAELPYSDPPQRLEGFAAYRAYVEPALAVFRFTLDLSCVHPGLDPDLLVAEYTSDGTATPTGKRYRNVYIGVWRFRDGRISGLREFFNPSSANDALALD